MKQVSFAVGRTNINLILRICKRVERMCAKRGCDLPNRMDSVMDLCATHANGCPMDFERLLAADDFNFAQDFFGIRQHLDRKTGTLGGCFLPRCATPLERSAA